MSRAVMASATDDEEMPDPEDEQEERRDERCNLYDQRDDAGLMSRSPAGLTAGSGKHVSDDLSGRRLSAALLYSLLRPRADIIKLAGRA